MLRATVEVHHHDDRAPNEASRRAQRKIRVATHTTGARYSRLDGAAEYVQVSYNLHDLLDAEGVLVLVLLMRIPGRVAGAAVNISPRRPLAVHHGPRREHRGLSQARKGASCLVLQRRASGRLLERKGHLERSESATNQQHDSFT